MHIAAWLGAAAVIGLAGLSCPSAAQACAPLTAPLPDVVSAAKALQQIGAGHEDMNTDVSLNERKVLQAYKLALAGGVEARLACMPADAGADAIERQLATALGATQAGKPAPGSDATPGFGEGLAVGVASNPAQGQLMLVQVNFAIPCGDDNLLLGYRVADGKWRRVLLWQSPDYDSIAGALGSPFNVLPLAGGAVAVTHGTPWCTSVWSKFGLDVVRPAEGAAPQRTLYHLEHGYNFDERPSLTARPGGFEFRALVGSLDTDLMTRQGIFRYTVDGDRVERVQPAARNGRDFVDEWLTVEPALARTWSDPAEADDALDARNALMKDEPSISYGPVRACRGRSATYQVEINPSVPDGKEVPATRYALLHQETNGFAVLRFGATADPGCRGPNLMKR